MQSVIDSVEPARAALAALDLEHSAALAAWARVTGSRLPKIDADKRSALVRDLDDAAAQAAAATAAMDSLQAEARIAAEAAAFAHRAVWVASRLVLLDEAQSTSRRSRRLSPPRSPRSARLTPQGKVSSPNFAATTKHTEKSSLASARSIAPEAMRRAFLTRPTRTNFLMNGVLWPRASCSRRKPH